MALGDYKPDITGGNQRGKAREAATLTRNANLADGP